MIKKLYFMLFNRNKCSHEKITPKSVGKFCPDCGKRIEIFWYLIRCEQCYSKRTAALDCKNVMPEEKHCYKCGSKEFLVEKKDKLTFFDVAYAVSVKEEFEEFSSSNSKTQIWIDNENVWTGYIRPKLIPSFLK